MAAVKLLGADRLRTYMPGAPQPDGYAFPPVGLFGQESALTHLTRLYLDPAIDATGAYIEDDNWGTTPVSGELISATITWDLQRKGRYFADDSAAILGVSRGRYKVTASLVFEWADQQHYDDWQNDVVQRARLRMIGTNGKIINLDLSGKWASHEWGERENNVTAQMSFVPVYDEMLGAPWRISVAKWMRDGGVNRSLVLGPWSQVFSPFRESECVGVRHSPVTIGMARRCGVVLPG